MRGWNTLHIPIATVERALGASTAHTKELTYVQYPAQSVLTVAIVFLLAWFAWRRRGTFFARTTLADSSFWMTTVFALGYVALLVYTAATSTLDLLGNRLLSPVYPSLLIAFLIAAHHAWHEWRLRHSQPGLGTWLLLVAAVGVACLTLPYRVFEVYSDLSGQALHGAGGYTVDSWMRSATLAHARNWGPGVVYSNAPDLIYLRTGRIAGYFQRRDQGMDAFIRRTQATPIVLVQFNRWYRMPALYTFDELARHLPNLVSTRYSDGIVARSGPRTSGN